MALFIVIYSIWISFAFFFSISIENVLVHGCFNLLYSLEVGLKLVYVSLLP